jgi:hypothetical protein
MLEALPQSFFGAWISDLHQAPSLIVIKLLPSGNLSSGFPKGKSS